MTRERARPLGAKCWDERDFRSSESDDARGGVIVAGDDPADAVAAADAAAAALSAWSALGPTARRAALNAAADALEAKGDALVAAMMAECGAHEGWGRFNLGLAVGMIREAAALTTQIGGEVIPSDRPGCIALALREPAGVVLGIAPWNAPLILGVRAIAVPLACGNTVVLKVSEICPQTHTLIVEAFADAGFAPGVVGLVTNAPEDAGEVVGALIDHPAGTADQLYRLNYGGQDHRPACSRDAQAVPARARRQGAPIGARRC